MHLTSLHVERFKAYASADLPLPRTGLSLLVGANNAGKTALLGALDELWSLRSTGQVRRVGETEPALVIGTFDLTEDDRAEIFDAGRAGDNWRTSEAFRTLRIHLWDFDGSMAIREVQATTANGGLQPLARVVRTPESSQNVIAEWIGLTQHLGSSTPDAPWNLTNRVSEEPHRLDSMQALRPLDKLLSRWRDAFYHFRSLRQGTERQRSVNTTHVLVPTGANLPEVLLHAQTQDLPVWSQLKELLKDMLPDLGDLLTPTTGQNVEVRFRDPYLGVRQNLKDLGTGVEQVLMTAYVGLTQPSGAVVVIEEPETNLHPAAQRLLLEYLRIWSADKLFIIATHSPVFLDQSVPGSTVALIERTQGVSTVKPVETQLPDVLEAIGVRLSDVLSASRVLIVEGNSDVEVIRAWFPTLVARSDFALVPSHGSDRAWNLEWLDQFLASADALSRRFLYLRDRDELPEDKVDQLRSTQLVHVLTQREIENYLLDPEAILRAIGHLRPTATDESPWTAETIREALREEADRLKMHVVLKRTAATVEPIYLNDRRKISRLCERGPSLDGLLEVVRSQLPPPDIEDRLRTTWAEELAAVDAHWDAKWCSLAPGSDVLEGLWKRAGLGAYDKQAHGPLIASAMAQPPSEIAEVLESL